MKVSFILPVLNEEKTLATVLMAIESQMNKFKIPFELIVVDNMSTDDSVDIAKIFEAHVLTGHRGLKIGALRNRGAALATGDILAFIDGDVIISENWAVALKEFNLDIPLVTGAPYQVDPEYNWITNDWFKPLQHIYKDYVNGGNLIVSKKTFEAIGGFSEVLETGEDVEFSQRARSKGITVQNNNNFETFHLGYPTSLLEFFKRERWHGKGNFYPMDRIFKSGTSVMLLTLWLQLVLIAVSPVFFYTFLLTLCGVVFSMAFKRGPTTLKIFLERCGIATTFIFARMSAIFS